MIKSILEISALASPERTLEGRMSKLSEEVGEIATVVNKPHKEHPEPLVAEVCDAINILVDMVLLDIRQKHPDWSLGRCKDHAVSLLDLYGSGKRDKWKRLYIK